MTKFTFAVSLVKVMNEDVKRFTVEIPSSLHRQIKSSCALSGTNMSDAVRLLLEREYAAPIEPATARHAAARQRPIR